jgi:hypothetical protein
LGKYGARVAAANARLKTPAFALTFQSNQIYTADIIITLTAAHVFA